MMSAASIRLLSKSFCDNFIAKMSLGCAKPNQSRRKRGIMELLHDLNTYHKNSFSLSRHRHKGIFQHTIMKDNNFCWAYFEMSEAQL